MPLGTVWNGGCRRNGPARTETEDGVAMVFEEQARRYQELIKRASDLRSYL